jgi:hypothetical protein
MAGINSLQFTIIIPVEPTDFRLACAMAPVSEGASTPIVRLIYFQ